LVIELDLRDAIPHELVTLLDSQDLAEIILDQVSESARLKWLRIATSELRTSRQSYADGIQPVEAEPGRRTLTLLGWLANAIEGGLEPFDLRSTLLGPGARNRRPLMRQTEGGQPVQVGWYANVPFRHGTPGTTGLAGTPMGQPYGPRGGLSRALSGGLSERDAAKLGKAVYAEAKRRRGRALSEAHGGPKLAPHHTTGIYTGMRRVEGRPPQGGGAHRQYFTFRRISTANPTGWIHPGIEPHRFLDQVSDHVAKIAPRIVTSVLDAIRR
jgi:hypothetical protein